MTVYACLSAGEALAAGQRHREALAAQLDPHTGESARLAAMAQDAEAALSALQATTLHFSFCAFRFLALVQALGLGRVCKVSIIP